MAKEFRDTFLDIIRCHVDTLILNDTEARYLAGCDKESEIMKFLLSQDLKRVALTKGSRGSVIAAKNKIYHINVYTSRVLDTTGAGDAYASGFIYGLVRGWREDKAADFASRIAGKVVSQWGARFDI